MIFLEIICFEFPCVAGVQMTNSKHEEVVLHGIASNPQTPFDFSFRTFISNICEFVPKFWVQHVSNLNFVLKFRFRIDGLCMSLFWIRYFWNLFRGVLALRSFFLRGVWSRVS